MTDARYWTPAGWQTAPEPTPAARARAAKAAAPPPADDDPQAEFFDYFDWFRAEGYRLIVSLVAPDGETCSERIERYADGHLRVTHREPADPYTDLDYFVAPEDARAFLDAKMAERLAG